MLAEHLDRIGFDEMWFGEHHSGAMEMIAAPELMVAAAAQRTKYIRLGTGVKSLPFHNPVHAGRGDGAARPHDARAGHVRRRARRAADRRRTCSASR